ncbi:MAG TPA: hypothetical protein VGF86_04485 [Candidatus Tumulicola sp.]
MMTVAQYVAAVQAILTAAEFDATFEPYQSGNYICSYGVKQVVAKNLGATTVQFMSMDATFSRTDDLSNPKQIAPIANALMAYCANQPH